MPLPYFFRRSQISSESIYRQFTASIQNHSCQIPIAPQGFAYLFARFPSFTQTFCFREVHEMRQQGVQFPIFSIRSPQDEPLQDIPLPLVGETTYLPEDIHLWAKQAPWKDKRRALAFQTQLLREWGSADKKRALEAAWLLPILEKLGVSHVHVHFAGIAARVAYWMKRMAGIRYSFTAHANDFFVNSDHAHLADIFEAAEFVATVTNFSAEWLRERFPNRRNHIHRVYNGILPNQFIRPRTHLHPPRILSIGRYIEKKGFSDLIQACATIREESFECLIVGEGPLETDLKNQVRESGLEGKVLITGPRTESEIVDLLSATSIFVLFCKTGSDGGKDNLPTVIMEAMSASVPVIATSLAGIPEMVIHGETGYLVPEGDQAKLATAIKNLLQNPMTAKKMGEQGLSLAQEKFDVSVTTASLRALLIHYGAIRSIAN